MLLGACNPYISWSDGTPPGTSASSTGTSASTGTATGGTTTGVTTGTTAPPPEDCDDLPPPGEPVSWPFEYEAEEFTFDADGHVVTASDTHNAVMRVTRDGQAEMVTPYFSSEIAGMDILVDGDLVFADEAGGTLIRVGWDGATSTIRSGLRSPNSLAVHADGHIYTTAYDQLLRVDPETGAYDTIATRSNQDLDGVAFAPEFRALYFNEDGTGRVWRVPLDAEGLPEGPPEELADLSTFGGEVDGATADACGNLYVVRTDGVIYRITPDGEATSWVRIAGYPYTSAIHFGSGVGGWEADRLYVMDRDGRMFEIEAGVAGAPEPHL